MIRYIIYLVIVALFAGCKHDAPVQPVEPQKILLFTKTQGYRHESIVAGIQMFRQIIDTPQYIISQTELTTDFTVEGLAAYKIIVLLNTTGELFSDAEQKAIEAYVKSGGAILGIHAATDAEYTWPWYNQMLGAWFSDHPAIQEAECEVKMPGHLSAAGIPLVWKRTDEWYNFKSLQPDNKVVINLKESTYSGGKHGENHPVSWYREFNGGRIFYTAMGHTSECYSDPLFRRHIKGAIEWLTSK